MKWNAVPPVSAHAAEMESGEQFSDLVEGARICLNAECEILSKVAGLQAAKDFLSGDAWPNFQHCLEENGFGRVWHQMKISHLFANDFWNDFNRLYPEWGDE